MDKRLSGCPTDSASSRLELWVSEPCPPCAPRGRRVGDPRLIRWVAVWRKKCRNSKKAGQKRVLLMLRSLLTGSGWCARNRDGQFCERLSSGTVWTSEKCSFFQTADGWNLRASLSSLSFYQTLLREPRPVVRTERTESCFRRPQLLLDPLSEQTGTRLDCVGPSRDYFLLFRTKVLHEWRQHELIQGDAVHVHRFWSRR